MSSLKFADTLLFAVILAGGSGARLWPLSRSSRPKQLLTLAADRSLVQMTLDRLRGLVPPAQVLVMTERSHAQALAMQLPELPPENIVIEPARRGTAGSLALAALLVAQRSPGAVMASLHSDHIITDPEAFRRTLLSAAELAAKGGRLITLGVRPSAPSTQFGYVHIGAPLSEAKGVRAWEVRRFVEKPSADLADQYFRTGEYLWNSGIFVWRIDTILEAFRRLLPEIYGPLSGAVPDKVDEIYPAIPQQSIDVGILERAAGVAVVQADFGWSDVGNWADLWNVMPRDQQGNVVRGQHIGVNTRNSLVFATSRLVATLGLQGMVVVETPEAVFVCPTERAAEARALVERLEAEGRTEFL